MAFHSSAAVSQSGAESSAIAHQGEQGAIRQDRLTICVDNIIHFDKDSHFFVLDGKVPTHAIQPQIVFKGKPYFGKRLVVKGVSPTFGNYERVGQTVDFFGRWEEHPRHGLQFVSEYSNECLPDSPEGLEKYLAAGRLPGMGPALAKQFVQEWGGECFDILENHPERLAVLKGFNIKKAVKLQEVWKEKRAVYDIVAFLGAHGVGESAAIRVQELLGGKAIDRIKKNPFILTGVDGIGFKTADRVALSLGTSGDDPVRLKAALRYELDVYIQKEGNMAAPWEDWILEGAKQLGMPVSNVQAMAQELINEREVVLRDLPVTVSRGNNPSSRVETSVRPCISPRWAAQMEERIAQDLGRILTQGKVLSSSDLDLIWREVSSPARGLDQSQQEGAWTVLANSAAILTGGPGTGKTTTLKSVVEIATLLKWDVVLAAPTARAAKRMEEAIGMKSGTMHRTLKYSPQKGFQANDKAPLTGFLFILDEMSMVSSTLLAAWLRAIPHGARIVLVGDADQLPSVGAGDSLRDLIQSKSIPVAALNTIHRTAKGSGIAENAMKVNRGSPPGFGGNPWVDDYAFVETPEDDDTFAKIGILVEGFLRRGFRHEDIQILCPQRGGKVGTENLNQSLRWMLNPEAPPPDSFEEPPPCINGERLIQTVNDYDLEVFNGDLGTVCNMEDDGSFQFRVEDGRMVSMVSSNLRRMELGYAMTVHKSQGGERPVVIMPISRSHLFTLNRNLLFTGMTRGKNKLVLVGDKQTVLLAALKQDQKYRLTGLVQELKKMGVCAPASPKRRFGGNREDRGGVPPQPARTLAELDRSIAAPPDHDGFSIR